MRKYITKVWSFHTVKTWYSIQPIQPQELRKDTASVPGGRNSTEASWDTHKVTYQEDLHFNLIRSFSKSKIEGREGSGLPFALFPPSCFLPQFLLKPCAFSKQTDTTSRKSMAYNWILQLALHNVGVKSHSHKSIRGTRINIKNQNVFGIDSSLISLFFINVFR